jgi:hypothetical protein
MCLNPQAHRGMYLTYVFTLPPFGRITGIRFYGYNLSPYYLGTPVLNCQIRYTGAHAIDLNRQHKGITEIIDKSNFF